MKPEHSFSRRSFLAMTTAAPVLSAAGKNIPVGLEMYSVRDELKKDLMGTVRAVAKMGYQDMEFFAPYYDWSDQQAKDVRKLMDDLGVTCWSTHNGPKSLEDAGIQRAIDLNQILGSKYIVLASAGRKNGLDAWKEVAELLNKASEKLKPHGMRTGYHNHQTEFKMVDVQRPIEILAANTNKDVMLQLDVGTCVEVGADPVAWIVKNPGRIRSIHCKEWSPKVGYKALFGEGVAPWKKIFAAAESTGGVEFYLVEQEGSRYSALETAEKCLASFKKVHG